MQGMFGVKEMNKCLENAGKCNMMCCKTISFMFDRLPRKKVTVFPYEEMDDDKINYYNLHEGIKVVKEKDTVLVLTSPEIPRKWIKQDKGYMLMLRAKCSALTKDNQCFLYGSKDRPVICRDGYNKIKHNVVFLPNCIYKPEKDSLVLKEENIKELIKNESNNKRNK